MRLDSIKMKPRLIGAFLIVAVIAAIIGISGLSGMGQVQKAQDAGASVFLPSIMGLQEMAVAQQRIWVGERGLLNNRMMEPTVRAAQYKYIDNAWKRADAGYKLYEPLPKSTDEAALWKEFKPKWDEWRLLHERVVALAREKDQMIAAGVALDSPKIAALDEQAFNASMEARTKALPTIALLDKIININGDHAAAADKAADKAASSTRAMIISFIIIGVLMAMGLGFFIANSIAKPVAQLSAVADKLALGDVDVSVEAKGKDEIADLMRAMGAMVESIQGTSMAADMIAQGDLSIDIMAKSEKDVLSVSMQRVVTSLRGLVTEMNTLSSAAIEGRLDARGDASQFQGGYHDIVQGVNDTLDAVIGPLNMAAEYVERISNGDIPEQISDDYNGDFNEIKNNLNKCISAIDELAADADMLVAAAVEGQLDVRADASKHNGDFGKIIQGVNNTLDSVTLPINEAVNVLEQVASNDLTARMMGDYMGDHAKIKDSLNATVEALEAIIVKAGDAATSVTNTAKDVASTASEVGRASQAVAETINQVAAGSQEQTKMVTSASASMEQLSNAIDEVAKGAQSQAKTVEDTVSLVQQITMAIDSVAKTAQSAAGASQEVSEVAKQGGDSVEKSVEGMARIKETSANVAAAVVQLGENSKQIGAIVETIDDIAEQTNLLALNAAIEAARAGEHGKGFAVVADEVRKLAERSSLATKEIADLIGKIQLMTENAVEAMQAGTSEVEEGTELANQAGAALGSIVEAVNSIVLQIENVSAATEEMSASSAEVAKAVESLSAVTEESTAATEEMAATASEVTRSVEQVAAVSEENAASAEEVSAAAQEQNASVEEMSASAAEVARIADGLMTVVSAFKVNDTGLSSDQVYIEESAPVKRKKAA